MLSRCHRPGAPGSRGGATTPLEGTQGSCPQAGLVLALSAPKAACPGQEVGSEVAWALDRLQVCWPGRQETGCPARADGQHADLPRPSEPRTRPGQAAGAGGPGAAGGGVGDTGLPVWSERGLAAGRVGVGCDGAGPRLVLGCRHHVPPRPPEAVRPCVCILQSDGIGDCPRTAFYLSHLFKDPLHTQPRYEGQGGQRCTGGPGGRSPARDRPCHTAGGAGPGPVGCTGPCRAVSGRAVLPGRGPRPAPTDGQAAHPRRRRKVTRTAMGRRKPHHELRSGQALRVNEAD